MTADLVFIAKALTDIYDNGRPRFKSVSGIRWIWPSGDARVIGDEASYMQFHPSDGQPYPDLSHDGTVGILAGFVRDHWGPNVTIAHVDGPTDASTTISNRHGEVLFATVDRSYPVRLAMALEITPS